MARSENIPAPAVRRLSLYLRQLEVFHAGDRRTVSSRQLGEALSLSDAQVRKDLAYFGQFGCPGIGYRVPELIQRLRRILGTDKKSSALLVGLGNLGRALVSYRGFTKQGFEIVAVFDNDTAKVGRNVSTTGATVRRSIPVHPMTEMPTVVQALGIRLGILTVPGADAQGVAEQMVEAGIRGILNFAPVTLQVDGEVAVSSVDLAVHLEQLSFQLTGLTT